MHSPIACVKYTFVAILKIAILAFFTASTAQNGSTAKAHHTPTGFKNNYVNAVSKSFPDFMRWQWESWGLDKTASN